MSHLNSMLIWVEIIKDNDVQFFTFGMLTMQEWGKHTIRESGRIYDCGMRRDTRVRKDKEEQKQFSRIITVILKHRTNNCTSIISKPYIHL